MHIILQRFEKTAKRLVRYANHSKSRFDPTEKMNASNGSREEYILDIQPVGFQLIGIFISICCVLGVAGNLLIIIVFAKKRSVRRPINFFVLNLAVSDLIVSLLGYPMTAVSAFSNRWIFKTIGCKIYAFICFNSAVSSIMTHAALALCRYIIICQYGYRKKITEMTVLQMLFSIWLFALFWTLSPLLGWSSYVVEVVPVSCSVNWYGRDISDFTYNVALILAVYLFPLSVIVFSYGMILRAKLCSDSRKNGSRTRQGYTPRYIQDLEGRVTFISFLMMTAFMVAWTPYAVMSTMVISSFNFDSSVAALPTLLAKASCAYNPFIYAFTNSVFRDTVVEIMAPWTTRRVGVSTLPWPRVTYYPRRADTVDIEYPDENLFLANSCVTEYTQERFRRKRISLRNSIRGARIEPRDPTILSPRTVSIDFSVI
ncbi:rhodopsin, G0-coupled-like [Ylistrum balloti]|uniref:rhodopsin, G0-coupled-like n=1 Tax=Ylistrum balloti TaxID=509963 RepID=UPI0029058391|nr:rhodopsin, G0-coupled-like [Ylistrum balloti]